MAEMIQVMVDTMRRVFVVCHVPVSTEMLLSPLAHKRFVFHLAVRCGEQLGMTQSRQQAKEISVHLFWPSGQHVELVCMLLAAVIPEVVSHALQVRMPMLDDGTMFAARETAQYLSQTSNSLYPFTVGEVWAQATVPHESTVLEQPMNSCKIGRGLGINRHRCQACPARCLGHGNDCQLSYNPTSNVEGTRHPHMSSSLWGF